MPSDPSTRKQKYKSTTNSTRGQDALPQSIQLSCMKKKQSSFLVTSSTSLCCTSKVTSLVRIALPLLIFRSSERSTLAWIFSISFHKECIPSSPKKKHGYHRSTSSIAFTMTLLYVYRVHFSILHMLHVYSFPDTHPSRHLGCIDHLYDIRGIRHLLHSPTSRRLHLPLRKIDNMELVYRSSDSLRNQTYLLHCSFVWLDPSEWDKRSKVDTIK